MAVDHFEVGKSYCWLGTVGQRPRRFDQLHLRFTEAPHPHWVAEMDPMLDGLPHQCLAVGPCDCARFEGCGVNNADPDAGWSWHPWLNLFEAVN
jgi:hypothetical protein